MDVFTEDQLYDKLQAKEELSERGLWVLVQEYGIESEEGDEGRWERHMTTISKVKDKFYRTYWSRGLTECQEDSYYDQPFEVKLEEKEVTITQRNWNKVE